MPRNGRRWKGFTVFLFDLPEADFRQAVIGAAEAFKPTGRTVDDFAPIVEKDYYVTEALRIIAREFGNRVIFKGGTSLSKGWDLIERFSEDVDLFIDQRRYPSSMGKKKRDAELKRLRDAVGAHPRLPHAEAVFSKQGVKRSDRFAYPQQFPGIGNAVLVEVGTAGGNEPTDLRTIRSYLARFVESVGQGNDFEDVAGFEMTLLHYRRTFVEKLFTIHSKIELLKRNGEPLGGYARHYYDLYQLGGREDVVAMLKSSEYEEIRVDYDVITREHYATDYLPPAGLRFNGSDALFPTGELNEAIAMEYERQCGQLCYGKWPKWKEVKMRFEELKSQL